MNTIMLGPYKPEGKVDCQGTHQSQEGKDVAWKNVFIVRNHLNGADLSAEN